MKLTQIRDLVAVAQSGGLRRAARLLGLAQPAITRSIRALETELDAPLFERNTMGMVLTPIGEAFFRRSVAIQREIDRAIDEVRQIRGLATGIISIGLSTAPHVSLLPKVIAPFRRKYPDILVQIREGLFPAMEPEIREGAIDFYVGPLSEHQLTTEFSGEKLFDNNRVVLARPGHPLADATSLTELAQAGWVATSVTADHQAELGPLFQQHGLPPPKIALQAHTALTMVVAAASSDLLAMLPQQWLEFANASGMLVDLPLVERLTAPSIYIVSRASLPLTPVAQHLADLFRRASLNQPDYSAQTRASAARYPSSNT